MNGKENHLCVLSRKILSRIFDAVYDTVKQVSAELIKGKVVSSEVEKNDLNDLEQLVSRRRNEYR